jgi:hypothetical protein
MSRGFSIAPPTVTVSFPVRMGMKLAAAANALQGLLTSLTKISFTAARASPAHAGFFSTFFARALVIRVSAATFQPAFSNQTRTSFSAQLSSVLVTGYGAGGYGSLPYGYSPTSPQILVLKTIAAQTATMTVSFATTLIVALVKFAASTATLVVLAAWKISVQFVAGAFTGIGYGGGGYGLGPYGGGPPAGPTGLKGFVYGLIRKIRVRGGR